MAKRIFVVDDENVIADTLAAILRRAGYEASAFYDAQSALAQVEAARPELVISDVVMPGMSGLDMAVLIRERHPVYNNVPGVKTHGGSGAEVLVLPFPIPQRLCFGSCSLRSPQKTRHYLESQGAGLWPHQPSIRSQPRP
jgi:CheY-like chemotaxis protein